MTIRKEDFIAILNTIQVCVDRDAAFGREASKYFGCNFSAGNHDGLITVIVNSLDRSSCCCGYISDWVFDMNFGRRDNIVTVKDRQYTLATAEDLFNFLTELNNEQKQ